MAAAISSGNQGQPLTLSPVSRNTAWNNVKTGLCLGSVKALNHLSSLVPPLLQPAVQACLLAPSAYQIYSQYNYLKSLYTHVDTTQPNRSRLTKWLIHPITQFVAPIPAFIAGGLAGLQAANHFHSAGSLKDFDLDPSTQALVTIASCVSLVPVALKVWEVCKSSFAGLKECYYHPTASKSEKIKNAAIHSANLFCEGFIINKNLSALLDVKGQIKEAVTETIEGKVQENTVTKEVQEERSVSFSNFVEETMQNLTKANNKRLFEETGIHWEQIEPLNQTSTRDDAAS